MDWLNWSFMVPVLLAAIGTLILYRDIKRAPAHRKPYRIIEAAVALYFLVYYTLAWTNLNSDAAWYEVVRTGLLSRIGMAMLMAIIIVDVLSFGGRHAGGTD